jgi:hypothetical protein
MWLLERGCRVLAKDYSSKRSRLPAENVGTWYDDPGQERRQVGPGDGAAGVHPGCP